MNGERIQNVLIYFSITTNLFLIRIFLLPIFLFSPGRYYRANSVRFPTQACEGVCSLNHYCAITRIDYREYRQCLETAASALASGMRSNNNTNKILLLLIALIQLLLNQQFVVTEIIRSAIHVRSTVFNHCSTFLSPFKLMQHHSPKVC